jgi:hypothetical protein
MPIVQEEDEIFIVSIGMDEDAKAKWKGYIKYPPDKKKIYFTDLFEFSLLLVPCLEKMGVQVGWFWRVISWYKTLTSDSQCKTKEMT